MNTILQRQPVVTVAQGTPEQEQAADALHSDGVYVVYTSPDETVAALRAACAFAGPIGIPVTLVHVWAVPYGQDIDARCGISPIETDAFADRLAADGLSARRRVYVCRDRTTALPFALRRRSLVFLGARHRWRLASAMRLRRALGTAGHLVVVVDSSHVMENTHA